MGRQTREKATDQVLAHVERARVALKSFREDRVTVEGVFMSPQFQSAALKIARDELEKAIGIMDRTKWK